MFLGKFFVVANFSHFPLIKHYNLVGIFNCTEAMSHDNYCFSLVKFVKLFYYHAFVVGVKRVGGFVKEDVVGVLIYCPSYEYALLLALAQPHAIAPNLGVLEDNPSLSAA